EAGAQKNDGFGVDAAESAERFFAVHEWHREIEQDQIEVVRTLPENIETFETRLRGHYFEPGFDQNPFRQDKRHRLVVDDENAALFPRRWRSRIFCRCEIDQVRMEQRFFFSAARVLDEPRGHFRRAIYAGSQHLKILLRAFTALPNILDDRAGPGNDFEEIV